MPRASPRSAKLLSRTFQVGRLHSRTLEEEEQRQECLYLYIGRHRYHRHTYLIDVYIHMCVYSWVYVHKCLVSRERGIRRLLSQIDERYRKIVCIKCYFPITILKRGFTNIRLRSPFLSWEDERS